MTWLIVMAVGFYLMGVSSTILWLDTYRVTFDNDIVD